MAENDTNGLNRREFLRKAAITGAVAWAVPVVQSISATPAYAQGTPFCDHSLCVNNCIQARCVGLTGAARAACNAQCQSHCMTACPPGSQCDPSVCQF
jgi:hypothetical protein